jgi:hypothetical protein
MAKKINPPTNKRATGPKPEVLKIEGIKWKDAVKKSFEKQKPPEGWPKPEPKKKQKS